MAAGLQITPKKLARLPLVQMVVGVVLALVLDRVGADVERLITSELPPDSTYQSLAHVGVRLGIVAAMVLAAFVAIRSGVSLLSSRLERQAGVIVRNLTSWTLYAIVGLWIASTNGVNLSALLVGGAIVGVVIAAASQASLGNFFAGLVLLFSRPYHVGGAVRLRGPGLVGDYEGTVVDMGALYTTLVTPAGEVLKVPNSAVITSALVLGEAPLQAEIEVELPPGTPLGPIEEALRARLGVSANSVTIRPVQLDAGPDGKLVCRVQVHSATPVEPAFLAEGLAAAVAAAAAPSLLPS